MRKVDLNGLELNKRNQIKWENSIGKTLSFIYEEVSGELKIVDYDYNTNKILVEYANNKKWIQPGDLKRCSIKNLIKYEPDRYKYKIGQHIVMENRDITILDRETREYIRKNNNQNKIVKTRFYKIICNKCKQIRWIKEKEIEKDSICKTCEKFYTKRGINDIATLHLNLLPYFDDPKIAQQATLHSNKITGFHCPKCFNRKQMIINNFVKYGYNCVNCDNVGGSFPEKFFQKFLNQLHESFKKQITHTTFNWLKEYGFIYDFYLYDYNALIETHGIQHYEEVTFTKRTLKEEQENDKLKEQLAKDNGIKNYIILDCRYSNMEWIKGSIMNSILPELLNFTEKDIDWHKCELEALKNNIMEDVCEYWNTHQNEYLSTTMVAEIFNINESTINKYLKAGTELGLCNYDPKEAFYKSKIQPRLKNEDIKKITDYWNEHYNDGITTTKMSEVFGISKNAIQRYLKKGTELGFCDYDGKKELKKSVSKNGKMSGKIVNVYDKNTKYLHTFFSNNEAAIEMTKIYNKNFYTSGIGKVCRKENKQYKDFIFRYDDNDELKQICK